MSEPFLGQIMMFGGNFAPRGWALCDGQLLSIAQNTALFSILGTTYGGNGQTTFGLPDLRGRAPVHAGSGPGLSPYTLGESTGSESVTLAAGQLASHTHPFSVPSSSSPQSSTASDPAGTYPGIAAGGITLYSPSADGTMGAANTGPNAGGQPVPVVQPVLCVNFIIALQGIYPSRN